MEGAGVTNYDTSKSSYAISAATTEFDDALIQRGIVTRQQALVAKGASEADANRMVQQQEEESCRKKQSPVFSMTEKSSGKDVDDDENDIDDDAFEDDEFFAQYRQQRLREMKDGEKHVAKRNRPCFGDVVPISRAEWQREVNEASTDQKNSNGNDSNVEVVSVTGCWVVVCLTSSDSLRTGCMETAIQNVARIYPHVKFVVIPYTSAIPNWPMENLPSLFLYRHGKMQQELVRLPTNLSTQDVEEILRPLGVLSDNDDN
jgi:Phosducin